MWPFRRARAQATPLPAAAGESPGWDRLPALQRVTPTIEPLLNPAAFESSLVSWRAPARFLSPLGHHVTAAGPAGTVAGLVRPVAQRAAGPAMPLASPAWRRPEAAPRPLLLWSAPAAPPEVPVEPAHAEPELLQPIDVPVRTLPAADPPPEPIALSRVAAPLPLPVIHLPPVASPIRRMPRSQALSEETPPTAPLAGAAEPLRISPPEPEIPDSPGHSPETTPPVQRSASPTPAPEPAPAPAARPRRLGLGAPLPPADRPRVQRSQSGSDAGDSGPVAALAEQMGAPEPVRPVAAPSRPDPRPDEAPGVQRSPAPAAQPNTERGGGLVGERSFVTAREQPERSDEAGGAVQGAVGTVGLPAALPQAVAQRGADHPGGGERPDRLGHAAPTRSPGAARRRPRGPCPGGRHCVPVWPARAVL